jgi:biotin carboxyl carrier protein
MSNLILKGMHNNEEQTNMEYKIFHIDETNYKTLLTKKFENRTKWQKPDERKIYSFLPGTIRKIAVKKGDKVVKGDLLMVFEAMKMMNSIKSEFDGTIKEIHLEVGSKFPKNTLLIEFK